IVELLDAEEQTPGSDLHPTQYDIQLTEVDFSYHSDAQVLSGVTFHAGENQLTALVGASGSGKTTITSLMARFWDVDGGSIRIGGVDLREMSIGTVYGMISEVFQEVYLFDGSIYDNILLGNPAATEEEVMEAARQAQLMEFVERLPEGLKTKVGEGGSKLSGGQKQRVSIARALLKDAPIVLLDEATSSLDPENEIYIQDAIRALVKDKTVVVIAHRLSTIRNAEQIVVLDDGRVLEKGTHAELLARNGRYARMWYLQEAAGSWKLAQ
ncbi:MAG: ATP-binding cassette domain-containing protein, partial [Bacteroidota bacterium]